MKLKGILFFTVGVFFLFAATSAFTATRLNGPMRVLVDGYAGEARNTDSGFTGFSAERGSKLFFLKRMHTGKSEERSCTRCHTKDPSAPGKTTVGKKILPISPAANNERFTEPKKVKKWFRRNCKWVLERECTPLEKGDYITFMMSL